MEHYTLANLIQEVKDRLGDEEFSDETITNFLNFAQAEILGEDKYPFLEKIDEFEDMEGSGELDLPKDYQSTINLYAIFNGTSIKLEYKPFVMFESGDRTCSYTVFGNRVFYSLSAPKGNGECNNSQCCNSSYIIKHFYLAKPIRMIELGDTPLIPEEYCEALVLSALSRAESRRDNFDYAQIYKSQAEAIIVNMKTRYGMRQMSFGNKARLPFNMGVK